MYFLFRLQPAQEMYKVRNLSFFIIVFIDWELTHMNKTYTSSNCLIFVNISVTVK